MIKTIVVTGRELTGKISGQKYIAFFAVKRDGSRVALKFRKEVEGLPRKAGKYEMDIETASMNSSTRDGYEVWWVSQAPVDIREFVPEDTAKDQF